MNESIIISGVQIEYGLMSLSTYQRLFHGSHLCLNQNPPSLLTHRDTDPDQLPHQVTFQSTQPFSDDS